MPNSHLFRQVVTFSPPIFSYLCDPYQDPIPLVSNIEIHGISYHPTAIMPYSFTKITSMILATDLDGTFLGGTAQHKEHLYKTIRENDDFRLIFVTGRGVESVLPLLSDPVIPRPDYIICDVGATVLDGHTLRPVQPIGCSSPRTPAPLAVRPNQSRRGWHSGYHGRSRAFRTVPADAMTLPVGPPPR